MIQSIAQRHQVVDVSDQAGSRGVRCGMSAAEAQALCPNLVCADQDLIGDYRALDALGRWLIRFTPAVSRASTQRDDSAMPVFALFLDLTGCERLFGGLVRLVELIRKSLVNFNIPAHLAVAPTPAAAWAFATTGGRNPTLINAAQLHDSLLPLPVTSLRLGQTIVENLQHLGLHTIGQVLALPRNQLPARFGKILLDRLDQLNGVLDEPLAALVADTPIAARMEFDSPIQNLQDIWLIFEKLLNLVLADLIRRNQGVRKFSLVFKPDRGWGLPTITRTIEVSRPHRDRAALLNLIRCETDRVDFEYGFVRFQIKVDLYEAISDAQSQLFEQQVVQEQLELDRLLERLRARLGDRAVIQPELAESYLPERAWQPALESSTAVAAVLPSPRPLTVFPTPIEIRVTSQPSDDRTGHPSQFIWQGNVHRLTCTIGPERIAGEWWRGHHHTRDYYEVEDEAGCRFWIFRVLHVRAEDKIIARWFLHGRFD